MLNINESGNNMKKVVSYLITICIVFAVFPNCVFAKSVDKISLDEVNVRFLNLQRVTSQFNSIRMAITNFMGFHQVLNL